MADRGKKVKTEKAPTPGTAKDMPKADIGNLDAKRLRNLALALASSTLLIECIDHSVEGLLFETKYKILARKFQRECERLSNRVFKACFKQDELEAYEQNEKNMGFIMKIFGAIPILDDKEINQLLDKIDAEDNSGRL